MNHQLYLAMTMEFNMTNDDGRLAEEERQRTEVTARETAEKFLGSVGTDNARLWNHITGDPIRSGDTIT
jgi:hypothetical protein